MRLRSGKIIGELERGFELDVERSITEDRGRVRFIKPKERIKERIVKTKRVIQKKEPIMARAERKARRKKRKERRKRRKEIRMERKEKRLQGGTLIERLGQGISGVVEGIAKVRDINEGYVDPSVIDAGYNIVEAEPPSKTGFDMDKIKEYWWVGAIALALFFFRKRIA